MSMATTTALLLFVVATVIVVADGNESNDQTLQPEASGAGVVEATVSKIEASCIFPDDKLFLRRLAYVESGDGQHPDTFRKDYFGGIWQVEKEMFNVTKSSSFNNFMRQYVTDIQSSFNIDWPSTAWSDLTKPLYSALGAYLYIVYSSRYSSTGIPRDITLQASFWRMYYRPSGDTNDFVDGANHLETGCQSSAGADIIFVLDGSGSVGSTNFQSMKQFVKDVVSGFDVGPGKTRFGVIKYSSYVLREFDLDTYTTKDEILNAVNRIQYPGGGTSTHLALDELRTQGFSSLNGARPQSNGHPRVAIVVTDGQSASPPLTVTAARRVHDDDITTFAIGVGSGVYLPELNAIASDPVCLHLFLLSGFNDIEGLKSAIEKRTCDAPVIMDDNSTISGELPPGGGQNCKIKVPKDGVTVKLSSRGGRTVFYTSKSTYPSSNYYEHRVVAVSDRLGVLYVPQPPTIDEDGLVFCNIEGDNSTSTNISIGVKPGDQDKCRNNSACLNGGSCYNTENSFGCDCPPEYTGNRCQTVVDHCTPNICNNGDCQSLPGGYVCTCKPGFTGTNCDTVVDHCTPNICNNGDCHSLPGGYVCTCKPGFTGTNCDTEYRPDPEPTDPPASTAPDTAYNCDDKNPCTPENIAAGLFYFPAEDSAKFIQCSQWGQCFVMPCPDGLVWDAKLLTCNYPPAGSEDNGQEKPPAATDPPETYSCANNNPCTDENLASGLFYYPGEDSTRYVQCSESKQCFDMSCPAGLVWDQSALTCSFP